MQLLRGPGNTLKTQQAGIGLRFQVVGTLNPNSSVLESEPPTAHTHTPHTQTHTHTRHAHTHTRARAQHTTVRSMILVQSSRSALNPEVKFVTTPPSDSDCARVAPIGLP